MKKNNLKKITYSAVYPFFSSISFNNGITSYKLMELSPFKFETILRSKLFVRFAARLISSPSCDCRGKILSKIFEIYPKIAYFSTNSCFYS